MCLFFGHVVHRGLPIVYLANFVAGTGVKENTFCQRGFSSIDVCGNTDVANRSTVVFWHENLHFMGRVTSLDGVLARGRPSGRISCCLRRSIFFGEAFGASTTRVGEVVFNTAMTGYQEVLTDPRIASKL